MTFLLHKGGTRRGMMPMSMHYDDAEADFPLTNPRGRQDYQDYQGEIKTHSTTLNIIRFPGSIVKNLLEETVVSRMTFFWAWSRFWSRCNPSPQLTIAPTMSAGYEAGTSCTVNR